MAFFSPGDIVGRSGISNGIFSTSLGAQSCSSLESDVALLHSFSWALSPPLSQALQKPLKQSPLSLMKLKFASALFPCRLLF